MLERQLRKVTCQTGLASAAASTHMRVQVLLSAASTIREPWNRKQQQSLRTKDALTSNHDADKPLPRIRDP